MSECNVLLLGNGGREHAWAIALKSAGANIISWSPVINPGIAKIASKVFEHEFTKEFDITKFEGLNLDYAVIGPEAPLVAGIGDWLEEHGITVFGPNKLNARIEGSKIYMRRLMTKYNIPGNLNYHIVKSMDQLHEIIDHSLEWAVKPNGLTGGKGVFVYGDHLKSKEDILRYGSELIEKDGQFLLEQLVSGIEFSLQGFASGEDVIFLPLVKDYKRAYDNDVGPNTGSMGSCSFEDHILPYLSEENVEVAKDIIKRVVKALKEENGDYVGAIYGQFMLTKNGIYVVEFNARLGDPEAINTLALLETPITDIIAFLLRKSKQNLDVKFKKLSTVCIYLVPNGYPEDPQSDIPIHLNMDDAEHIRFASVKQNGTTYLTTHSRSIAVIGYGNTLIEARENAYNFISNNFKGLRYRTDIGLDLVEQKFGEK